MLDLSRKDIVYNMSFALIIRNVVKNYISIVICLRILSFEY